MNRILSPEQIASLTAADGITSGSSTHSLQGEDSKCLEGIFYDAKTGKYYYPNQDGWVEMSETSLKRHLRQVGLSRHADGGRPVSQLDETINAIQLDHHIHFAGALAGRRKGLFTSLGKRILVTFSPNLIEPRQGDWSTLHSFVYGMFDGEQQHYLYGWMQRSVQQVLGGERLTGQALVLAGEAGCGKSLLQNLITEMLGGRSAKPYLFMAGKTPFNSDLFGAEHLMIEDESALKDTKSRVSFGHQIKAFTVNETQHCHPKGREAFPAEPLWRMSISVNDDPEALMVLPPLVENVGDKMMILKAAKGQFPIGNEEGQKWRKGLSAELPAFIHWLLYQYVIPERLQDGRYGIKHYHHPDIVEAIGEMAPEEELYRMIEAVVLETQHEDILSAEKIESMLLRDQVYGRRAERLLRYPNACARYLGRLEKKDAAASGFLRVKHDRNKHARQWVVRKPISDSGQSGTQDAA